MSEHKLLEWGPLKRLVHSVLHAHDLRRRNSLFAYYRKFYTVEQLLSSLLDLVADDSSLGPRAEKAVRYWVNSYSELDFSALKETEALQHVLDRMGLEFDLDFEEHCVFASIRSWKLALLGESDLDKVQDWRLSICSPKQFGDQLCLMDQRLFVLIQPFEFINYKWTSKVPCPNLAFFIHRFNELAYFVASVILRQQNLCDCVSFLEFFISVAISCLSRGNFHSYFSIMTGINLFPITRLKCLFEALSQDKQQFLQYFNEFNCLEDNNRTYRESVEKLILSGAPVVPHLAIHLRDINVLEQSLSLKDSLESLFNDEIAFNRIVQVNEMVDRLTLLKNRCYEDLEEVSSIQLQIQKEFSQVLSERELSKLSYNMEPSHRRSAGRGVT